MIYKMKNVIQDYAWGSINAIPQLLGYENKDNHPQAELWMGSHRRGASLLTTGKGQIPLSTLISENIQDILGEEVAAHYSDLPFLFKVLAAGSPLSIQVHPDKKQAEIGFARENDLSIPLDAFNRNYKDDNHKPEIICALTTFWAMRGFRKIDTIVANFTKADIKSFQDEVRAFSNNRSSEGLKEFFNKIMSLKGDLKQTFIREMVASAGKFESDDFKWVLKLHEKYPEDAAIAAPLYLNLVKLEPGQALYLSAGELHAYLDGLGMELMASSDNVLRGGLTPKHIDREELKGILNFTGADPEILEGEALSENIFVYPTPSEEFELSKIELNQEKNYKLENNVVQILFVSEGRLTFNSETGEKVTAVKGESLFIPSNCGLWTGSGDAVLYRASIPGISAK